MDKVKFWAKTSLLLTVLVIIAGSVVRVSKSGMGCPDWPKCFGKWIPPTSIAELPPDYQNIYLEKRQIKLSKFIKLLEFIGQEDIVEKLKNDKTVIHTEQYEVWKTWTEYINRLFGVLCGLSILIMFFYSIKYIRDSYLTMLLSFATLILLIFQAWFGSIVVATNLVNWTISVHLFLALGIFALLIHIILLGSEKNYVDKSTFYFHWVLILLLLYQFYIGTEVRKMVDNNAEFDLIFSKSTFGYHKTIAIIFFALLSIYYNRILRIVNNVKILHLTIVFVGLAILFGFIMIAAKFAFYTQSIHLLCAVLIFILLYYLTVSNSQIRKT